jgi:Retrotransposon gag protein
MLVLISGLTGNALIWMRQWRSSTQVTTLQAMNDALKQRFKDRTKAERAFNRLYTIKQTRSIMAFNNIFSAILLDLDP